MADGEVNPYYSRYIELTGRYKAAWTFHRFLEGLQKFFGNRDLGVFPLDFQSLYKSLKEVSSSLEDSDGTPVVARLDELEKSVGEIMTVLDEQDRKVSPSLLRLFFQKVQTDDERILIEMLRFYQEAQHGRSWEADRIDKADFLASRLGDLVVGPGQKGNRTRLNKVLARLSAHADLPAVDAARVANRRKLIQALRVEVSHARSFDELTDRDLVGHYRRLKHGLGELLFEVSILPLIVETNAILSERVNELSAIEERRIFADYERISRLEERGGVQRELKGEVTQLHQHVGRFQKRTKAGTMRISELSEVGEVIDRLTPKVEPKTKDEITKPVEKGEGGGLDPEAMAVGEIFDTEEARELAEEALRELAGALARTDADSSPEDVAYAREVIEYRLEPREIVAYRRLRSNEPCEDRLERFLLAAAALRRRINHEVKEIQATRSESPSQLRVVSAEARRIVSLADWYLRQFSHFLERPLLAGSAEDAREIQLLKMRLMRDYSGLWLVTEKER